MAKISNKLNKQQALKKFLSENYTLRYDVIRNTFQVKSEQTGQFEDIKENCIWSEINDRHATTSKEYLLSTIGAECVSPPFNPITTYMDTLSPLEDAVRKLADYIVFEDDSGEETERFIRCFTKWYAGLFRNVLDPEYVHKQAIVFQGPQGIGKTPFCLSLLPKKLRGFIKYAPHLDASNKDSVIALSRYALIIIDEINDFFKSRNNRNSYKSYFTQEVINERYFYGKFYRDFPRIASFIGTCNESNFLNDETGTQRFTVFKVKYFKNSRYSEDNYIEDFDFEGLAAYTYNLAKNGYNTEYTIKELKENEGFNEQFKYNSAEYETIINYLIPAEKDEVDAEFMTPTQICNYLNRKQTDITLDPRPLGRVLIRLNFTRKQKKINNRPIYGYYVKKIEQTAQNLTPLDSGWVEPKNTQKTVPF